MNEFRKKLSTRILAFAVAVLFMFGTVPMNAVAVLAQEVPAVEVPTTQDTKAPTVREITAPELSLPTPFATDNCTITVTEDVSGASTALNGATVTIYGDSTHTTIIDKAKTTDVKGETTFAFAEAKEVFYEVTLQGYTKATGKFTTQTGTQAVELKMTKAPAVSITTHPTAQVLKVGDPMTLSVGTNVTDDVTYQWKKDNTEISGANANTYTVASVAETDAGSYTCVVKNFSGASGENTDTSNAAAVTVSKTDTNVTLAMDPDTQTRPNKVTITAENIPNDATGTVTFYQKGSSASAYTAIETATLPINSTTFKASGTENTYHFQVEYSGDNKYNTSTSAEGTFMFAKGTQTQLTFAQDTLAATYGDTNVSLPAVNGGSGTGNLEYSSDAPSVVSVDQTTGALTIHQVGTANITAKKLADDDYNDSAVATCAVTVSPKPVKITGLTAESKVYNGDTTATVGGTATIDGVIDADKNNVTVTVGTATFDTKDVGNDKEVTFKDFAIGGTAAPNYTLTEQPTAVKANITAKELTVTPNSGQSKNYGAKDPDALKYTPAGAVAGEIPAFTGALTRAAGETIGKYAIQKNDLALADDTASGFVAANYSLKFIDTVTFEIKKYEPVVEATLSSTAEKTPQGWYRDDVYLVAPTGYLLSFKNDLVTDTWIDKLLDPDKSEKKDKEIKYYLKSTDTGAISEEKTIKYSRDNTTPEATITVDKNSWKAALKTITFGIFFKETQTVTITPTDALSGVYKTQYKIANDAIAKPEDINDWIDGTEFKINPEQKYVIYAKVTDNAGNYITINSNGMIVDSKGSTIKLTADAPNANGLYNKDVNIAVEASDPDIHSGIKSVDYVIKADDKETQSGNLFTFNNTDPTYDDLQGTVKTNITVDSKKNNSNNVVVLVTVTDNAGNVSTKEEKLKIDITAPTMAVSFDNNKDKKSDKGIGYFDAARTATIVIKERTENFDEAKATAGIHITAKDAKGKAIVIPADKISAWTTTDGKTPDDALHTATVTYDVSANYTVSMDYTDKADNANTPVNYGQSSHPTTFVVDTNTPTGTITVGTLGTWDKLIDKLTFGLWSKSTVEVTMTSDDVTSPIESLSYYKTPKTKAMTVEELDKIPAKDWTPYAQFSVTANEQMAVYARVLDYATNKTYVSTQGIVIDNVAPGYGKVAPEITVTPEQPVNGIYNTDVTVDVNVIDPITNNSYAGLKTIKYQVINHGIQTQAGTLFSFAVDNPTQEQLKQIWDGKVVVDKSLNDSNDVEIKITAEDNAGNKSEKSTKIKLDITTPKIDVVYNNSDFSNGKYLGNNINRIATITITELNFKNDDVVINLTQNNKKVDVENSFVAVGKNIHGENNKWQMEIDYAKYGDGDYGFGISYSDLAGNANDPVTYAGKTPVATDTSFVIDNTAPTGTISVDSNNWKEILNNITFGLFFKDIQTVNILPKDETNKAMNSGVFKTEYKIANDAVTGEITDWKTGTKFSIEPNQKYVIYARVTDKAGNATLLNSNGMVVDNVVSDIRLTPDAPNENGLYNENVNVTVDVSDPSIRSGIKSVDYVVRKDNVETQSGNLFTYNKENPLYTELKDTWNGNIVVDCEKNNSNIVAVEVTVTDNSGNVSRNEIYLKIDITDPTMKVSFDNNNDKKPDNDRGYFNAYRTATIVIKERAANFNAEKATAGIHIKGVDALNKEIDIPISKISAWTTKDSEPPDEATHTATVTYDISANYTVSMDYTDEADNTNAPVDYGTTSHPTKFTVDTNAPTGTITVGTLGTWDKLVNVLTFGLWSKSTVEVSMTNNDVTSPIDSMSYYKTPKTTALTAEELSRIPESDWTQYSPFAVNANEQMVVYSRTIDYATNTTYLNTQGMVIDNVAPGYGRISPEITVSPAQPVNDIYNTDVTIDVNVIDPITNNSYAGLKTITYQVLNHGQQTQNGTLFDFAVVNPTQAQLKQSWDGQVVVDKNLNDSNDVEIKIFAEDNAGNKSDQSTKIKIDITTPKIDVVYNNSNFSNGKYLGNGTNRRATITITDVNFSNEDVVIKATQNAQPIGVGSSFVPVDQNEHGENNKWQMEIDYGRYGDGDYGFDMSYSDLAGNANDPVTYAGQAPSATDIDFTIDNTLPVIAVSYDNNSAQNTNYYKSDRTATISVTEHNWNVNGGAPFTVNIKAENNPDGGYAPASAPSLSGWSSSGDTHTATITYAADGRYTFSASYTDLASNKANDVAEQVFLVDKTPPVVPKELKDIGITSFVNGSDSVVAPRIGITDNNLEGNALTITLTGNKTGAKTLDGSWSDTTNGRVFTFDNFKNEKEADDIYVMSIKASDKAGNETESGNLQFSVNRFGSTFDLAALNTMVGGYFKENKDVTFKEINPNKIEKDHYALTVSRNGVVKELKDGEDFSRTASEADETWKEYTYKVFKENFADDGKYVVTLTSKDEAKNENISNDSKKLGEIVSFAIDNTKPTAAISGVTEGEAYGVDSQKVTIALADNIKLSSHTVLLNGAEIKGNVVEESDVSQKIEVNIPSNFDRQTLEVKLMDEAKNENTVMVGEFLVNASAMVRFYQNKVLFFGSIIGAAAVLAGAVGLFVLKRKKQS